MRGQSGNPLIKLKVGKMNKIISTVLCILLFCHCSNKSDKSDTPEYDHLLLTEYANDYDDGRLVKSVITESGFLANSDYPATQTVCEHLYTYEFDKPVSKDEYKTEASGYKKLLCSTRFRNSVEEWIEWKEHDTVSYQFRENDSSGRLIRHIKKLHVSVPAFDFSVNDNFDESYRYDSLGNISERVVTDLSTGEMQKTLFYHDTLPSPSHNSSFHIVCFDNETINDTARTRRYDNGVLTDIFVMYEKDGSKWELTFTPDEDLVLSSETIEENSEKTVIIKSIEFQSIDSLFYQNHKGIKSVSVSPEQCITVIMEYDEYGNIAKEMRYTKFSNR
jgi:hypothetical protein